MLQCRTWEKAKTQLACYERREPEKSALYCIVNSGREKLPLVWEERFQAEYGALRPVVLKTFDQYLNCGILELGAARVYCDACRHSFILAFSCKARCLCPSCSAKRAVKFAEHLYDEVLEDVEHRHAVATIPVRLRCFFRYDRGLLDILFSAVWLSLREVLCPNGGVPGFVATVQTAGEFCRWNPHAHAMLANGTWQSDGTFMPFGEVTAEALAKLTKRFAERVLAALESRNLIDAATTAQILSQKYSGFSVWLGEPFKDKERELFVARYIERGPISLEKLAIQDNVVTYTTKDGETQKFDPLDFLALLSSHIPNTSESLTRYFGHYSSRSRGERLKKAALLPSASVLLSGGEPVEAKKKPSYSWAECLRRMYELDPLKCPKCGNNMRIIAFIRDQHEIENIMRSLHIPKSRAPPPIKEPLNGLPVSQFQYL